MGYEIEFTLPGLPKVVNATAGHHYRRKHAEMSTWVDRVALAVARHKPKAPLAKAYLKLIRHSYVCPDPDGLVSGFKYVVDGLVKNGVLVDDKMSVIGMPDYRWEKAHQKKGFITVSVSETEPAVCPACGKDR